MDGSTMDVSKYMKNTLIKNSGFSWYENVKINLYRIQVVEEFGKIKQEELNAQLKKMPSSIIQQCWINCLMTLF